MQIKSCFTILHLITFEQLLAQLECINITSQYCFRPSKRLYNENHVSDTEKYTKCHGSWLVTLNVK
jgi:hypothetical protein